MSATEMETPLRQQRVQAVAVLADRLGREPLRREIAAELGISLSYASSLVTDPDGTLERERKSRYAGTCDTCGGPTSGGDGRAKAPKRCMGCIVGDAVRPPRGRSGSPRRVWSEAKIEDAIVAWVWRHRRIPKLYDFIKADLELPAPCVGTIYRHCYRYEERTTRWWNGREHRVSTWNAITRGWADILCDLVPRLPIDAIVAGARNATLRARLFAVVGVERLMVEHGERIATDDYGTLWRLAREDWREPVVMVQVLNSTPEPDGTFKDYFLRVPPDAQTPREGIAWTFGVEAEEYELAVQT